jgi:hypothetical protein
LVATAWWSISAELPGVWLVVVLGTVHLLLVVGFRNRASVFLGWIWSYATYQVGVQLVTGLSVEAAAQRPNAPATYNMMDLAIQGEKP